MAVVGTETLAVVREPSADLLVLGDGENDIAIEVVSIRGARGAVLAESSE
jgi:hypothetical protein